MLYIGTSGWQYHHWRESFYPGNVKQAGWLGYYSRQFGTVELNNSFYRLPEAAAFERWREQTPEGFVFAVKASRFLTHLRRLRDPEGPVALLLDRARHLGPKLGPVLVQLPPKFPADPARLAAALNQFPAGVRVAVEFRDESWHTDAVRAVLEEHGAALCLADRRGARTPEWRTAGWGFIRFHEGSAEPTPCYENGALAGWAETVKRLWPAGEDVFCYFNNDWQACAIRDAREFARLFKPSRSS